MNASDVYINVNEVYINLTDIYNFLLVSMLNFVHYL